jgi:transcriptional regulator with GAF, ATPase, and Fis domain
VIAATNRELEAEIAAGRFRSDLFYRLNVFPIEMPALRDRGEDLPLLIQYFLDPLRQECWKEFRKPEQEKPSATAVVSVARQHPRVAKCHRTVRYCQRIKKILC